MTARQLSALVEDVRKASAGRDLVDWAAVMHEVRRYHNAGGQPDHRHVLAAVKRHMKDGK